MSLEAFIRIADSLVEFEAELNDHQFPVSSIYSLEIHKDELKSIWETLKVLYDKCLVDISNGSSGKEGEKEDNTSAIETVKCKYRNSYSTYCRCITQLLEEVQKLSRPSVESESVPQHGFKLPPCEIPIFDGDYATWPTFRDIFTAICLRNPRLSSVEKLFHLIQRTKNEPNDIVQKFPLTNENFSMAWKSLCTRYENKKVLINIQLKNLFSLSPVSTESSIALKTLQRDINSTISLLKSYDIDVKSWDPIFVFVCSNCLPNSTLTLWEQSLSNKAIIPEWSQMDTFLTSRHRTLESVSEIRRPSDAIRPNFTTNTSNSPKRNPKLNPDKIHAFQNNVFEPPCKLCPSESHVIRKCPEFLKMNHNAKLAEIKKNGLCINCFSKGHTVKNCKSTFSCYKCNKRHNTLLHIDPGNHSLVSDSLNSGISLNPQSTPFCPTTLTTNLQSTNPSENGVVQSYLTTSSRRVLLGTAIVRICHNGLTYRARALIDSGSEGTFVAEKLFNLLKLPYKRTSATISGLNNSTSAAVQKQCSLVLCSREDEQFRIEATALVVPHLSSCLPSKTIDVASFSSLPNITLADPEFYNSSKIDILLGGDILPSVMLAGVQKNICGTLMAQETVFGWILTGPVPISTTSSYSTIVSYFCEISLEKAISRFWEVEDIPQKTFISPFDQYCENLYVSTTKRNSEGRYIVSLPFKEGFPESIGIGESRNHSIAQFFRNEARLLKNPQLKEEYDEVLEEYITLDHMNPVRPITLFNSSRSYYMPHHAVIKPDSTTTKVRVVFNASSPTTNGLSLNDVLHTGPILQSDITILMLKWRFFQYVFNGDITKMYRQILVNPEHTSYQRIVHRKTPHGKVQDYELKTVTFGLNCAPYLAIRTIRQLADDVKLTHPLASNILRNYMYVDDALVGSHSISEAIESRNQLIDALKSAGFAMRKWTASEKEILSGLPEKDLLREDFLELEDSSCAKMLGIRWDALLNEFYFSVEPFPETCNYSRREVLSHIFKLYDPHGWLSPVVITAKIIMQGICTEGIGWDDVISPKALSQWEMFQSNYKFINLIRIPRWINTTPESKIQFHIFCDASEKAFAAALYIRVENENSVYTHLLTSKTKVAPIRTISIPRLELCGAVLAAEMIDHILPSLEIENYSVTCWTDSTIVLSWLAKPPSYWKTFVANRVSKIVQVINPSQWRHIGSEDNPADLASRGLNPQDLIDNKLWWHGPIWLNRPANEWYTYSGNSKVDTEEESKTVNVNFCYFDDFTDILDRFSSFSKALRVLSYVYRFFNSTHPIHKANYTVNSLTLSSSEVLLVQNRLISMTQKAYYPNECKALSDKQSISIASPLLCLNPFFDSEGLLRVCGRLTSSPALSYNERHPIILLYNCQYSRLLVRFIHEISIHGGNQLVLRLIRTKFWIPRIKNLIKATINKCKNCVIYKRHCQNQLMAALPPERSDISRPFSHTGLDFAGPFDIKTYTGRSCRITKGYVCVFICFSTKAIHLEATSDLSTSTFILAFNRFVSRRGCPAHLHSDNGTVFVGASKVLAKEFIETSRQYIASNFVHQNISWHFIPPGAPHMGGLWEAGVKSFKLHFRKIAGAYKHTFEEFQTLLSKIEACLNSRPLSPMSQDPSDLAALTPGHFLIGCPILVPIDPRITEAPMSLINRWQKLKVVHQHFCSRWKEEYLKELHKRNKWRRPTENLKQDMLVVIKDENLPPNSWRLGRISKVYYGVDARVRVADIVTQRGLITRPVTKLVILPLENELP